MSFHFVVPSCRFFAPNLTAARPGVKPVGNPSLPNSPHHGDSDLQLKSPAYPGQNTQYRERIVQNPTGPHTRWPPRCGTSGAAAGPSALRRRGQPAPAYRIFAECSIGMDQRYVDTVRAMKVVLNNLNHLDSEVTAGQRRELERLIRRLQDGLDHFLEAGRDEGLWIGNE